MADGKDNFIGKNGDRRDSNTEIGLLKSTTQKALCRFDDRIFHRIRAFYPFETV